MKASTAVVGTSVVSKAAAALAAAAVCLGAALAGAAPASATDSIKIFGEEEQLNGPNKLPYIGYTVFNLAPSSDPVPHNGDLYSAKLVVDGKGYNGNPMIERFGARAESGEFYPSIWGASTPSKLYFDIVGPVPNSVVWNDGIRDILAWIPGDLPLQPANVKDEPVDPPIAETYLPPESMPVESMPAESMPVETDPAIVATPNVVPNESDPLTEAIVAEPGFNAASPGGEGRR